MRQPGISKLEGGLILNPYREITGGNRAIKHVNNYTINKTKVVIQHRTISVFELESFIFLTKNCVSFGSSPPIDSVTSYVIYITVIYIRIQTGDDILNERYLVKNKALTQNYKLLQVIAHML